MRERTIGIIMAVALAVVVGLAALAMRRVPTVVQLATEDLPECATCSDAGAPTSQQCADAGGTVAYRRTSECLTEPSVEDVCGFGVPCFAPNDNGFYCRDAKEPYCHCEADDQCPDGFFCQFDSRSSDGVTFEPVLSSGQCWREVPDSKEPLRPLSSPSL